MATEVRMPQLSQSVVEGEITCWRVKVGERVELDQVIAEIVTDKVDVEMPSPVAGTVLEILVDEGATVAIGTPLLIVGEEGESLDEVGSAGVVYSSLTASIMGAEERREPGERTAAPAAPGVSTREGPIRAAPAARKLARELGVDLGTVAGSGPGGRLTADDVRRAAAGAATAQPPAAGPASAAPGEAAPATDPEAAFDYLPYTGRRRQIGQRLSRAKQTIPHVSVVEEVDVTDLVALRAEQKEAAAARGVKLTYLAYLARAVLHALERNPLFNASLEEDQARIAVKKFYNLGIAVDAPGGLVVPVLHGADRLDLLGTASGISRLAEKARTGGLEPADVQGSTCTISSVGGDAILFSTGVINAPEVALVNLHRIERRPVVAGDAVVIRSMMYVTLTFDHRVLDGGHATRFMRDFKQRVESAADWARLP